MIIDNDDIREVISFVLMSFLVPAAFILSIGLSVLLLIKLAQLLGVQ